MTVYNLVEHEKYIAPKCDIINIKGEDVISTSDWELPIIPFEDETNQE